MKKLSLLVGVAASLLFAGSAFAEGDLAPEQQPRFTGVLQRADVQAQLAVARQRGELLRAGEALDGSYGVAGLTADRARSDVRTEAVATAHSPNQNLDRKAFVNSTVPLAYTQGSLAIGRQAAIDDGALRK